VSQVEFESLVGRQLGPYVVEALLGEGAMGVVYRANHRALGRPVAIKTLKPHIAADKSLLERFFAEARAVNVIRHENIIECTDLVSEPGLSYIVMELLEGQTLSRAIQSAGQMPVRRAARIGAQVAAAIGAAHKKGIVHRDLKPDNVFLIERAGSSDYVKVLDFGIARLQADLGAVAATQTGALIGTPAFMSPEQVRGERAGPGADVYALGVMMFQMLAGRLPFQATTMPMMLMAHLNDAPPRVDALAQGVPRQLAVLIERALAKTPAERPQSMAEFREALLGAAGIPLDADAAMLAGSAPPAAIAATLASEAAIGTSTMSAATGQVEPRDETPPVRSNRMLALAGLAIVAAGGGAVWLKWGRAPAPLRQPTLGLSTLERFHSPHGSSGSTLASPELWDSVTQDLAGAATQEGAPVRWHAGALFAGAQALALRGKLDEATEGFRAAATADPSWAMPHAAAAATLANAGKLELGATEAQRAQQLEPGWWGAVDAEARVYATGSKYDQAIQTCRRALAMAPREPILLSELALLYHASRLDSEAERYARQALAEDDNMVSPHILLAERALEANDGTGALGEATRAAAVEPESVSAQLARADALALLHRDDDARDAYKNALGLFDRLRQKGAPESRLEEARTALAAGKLPPPRVSAEADDGSGSERPERSRHHATKPERSRKSPRTYKHDVLEPSFD
jgi:serine/threonine-protein kinase